MTLLSEPGEQSPLIHLFFTLCRLACPPVYSSRCDILASVPSRIPGLLLLLLLAPACGKTVEKQARDQIRTAAGANLDRDQVEIVEIREHDGFAVAEVIIRTAVKLRKENDRWVLDEVRLGDRRWESADRIFESLQQSRFEETRRRLAEVGDALIRYRSEHGRLPEAVAWSELIDILTPRYLEDVYRIDSWWTAPSYQITDEGRFVLRSAGADSRMGTDDDIVVAESLPR